MRVLFVLAVLSVLIPRPSFAADQPPVRVFLTGTNVTGPFVEGDTKLIAEGIDALRTDLKRRGGTVKLVDRSDDAHVVLEVTSYQREEKDHTWVDPALFGSVLRPQWGKPILRVLLRVGTYEKAFWAG